MTKSPPGEVSSFIGAPTTEFLAAVHRRSPQAMPEVVANLDALRALAVLLVLLDHVLDAINHKHPELSFHPYDWQAGRLGVLLFFVHTCLVLNFSMVRLRLQRWALFKSFMIRRAFRIYPLSILCVLAILVFSIPRMPWEEFQWRGWGNALSNLALTTNLTYSRPVMGPLWSLPVEVQMYVALPVIFIVLGPRRNLILATLLWLLSAVAAVVQPLVSDRLSVVGFSPFFMAGVLAFALSGRMQQQKFPAGYWLPFLMMLVCAYLILQRSAEESFSLPLECGFCLAVGVLLHCFRDSQMQLLNKVVHQIAKYSYGIYLFHCIALWIACFRLANLPEPVQWLLAVALLAVMSVTAFHALEKPAIRIGAQLASTGTPVKANAAPSMTS